MSAAEPMFVTTIIGTRGEIARWQHIVQQHAVWLGLAASFSHRPLADSTGLAVCRLTNPGEGIQAGNDGEAGPSSRVEQVLAGMLREGQPAGIRFSIESATGNVTAIIPPATPQPLYVHEGPESLVLADDLRLMASFAGIQPDPVAVFALFRHGFVPAPFTLLQGVRRCPGGSIARIDARTRQVAITRVALRRGTLAQECSPTDPARWLQRALDRALEEVPPRAELYFSGGVDSSLLATRLKRLGRKDVRFVHFSFGPQDGETVHARRVASALGVPLREVVQTDVDVALVASRAGRDYSFPFGDASVIPSNMLVHATIDQAEPPSAVIEGTGADGSFAVPCGFRAWRLLYAMPLAVRRSVGEWYRRLQLWQSHSPAARWCQTVRRSTQLPLEQAALAQNALDGIAYVTPPELDLLLQASQRDGLDAVLPDAAPDARLGMLDVLLACAGAMAPKTFDPLRARGVRPVYPYLSPAVVYGAALLPSACKCGHGEPKALLKSMLARELPSSLVYRAKSGFTPPYRRIFSSPAMQRVLHDEVLRADNILLDFCRADAVRGMVVLASRGQLNTSGCNFLWALAFSSIWLAQVREASRMTRHATPLPFEPCAASLVS